MTMTKIGKEWITKMKKSALIFGVSLLTVSPAMADGQWGMTGIPDNLKAGPACDKFTVAGVEFAINVHDEDAQGRWSTVQTAYTNREQVKVLTVFDYNPPVEIYAPKVACVSNLPDGTFTIGPIINAITVQIP